VRVAAAVGAGLVALAPAVTLHHPPALSRPVPGLQVHRGGGATVLVVDAGGRPADALEGLRRAGVRRLDVVVLPEADTALLAALRHRWTVRRVVVLEDLQAPLALVVGGLEVRVEPAPGTAPGARTRSARARVGSAG
jgi:hypothetical protein